MKSRMRLVIALMPDDDEIVQLTQLPEATLCNTATVVDERLLLDVDALIRERLRPVAQTLRDFYIESQGVAK